MRSLALALLLCLLAPSLCGCMMPDKAKQAAENETKFRQEGIIAPDIGDPAPLFSLQRSDGSSYDLSLALASAQQLLYFYPAVDTPNSTANLIALPKLQQRLEEKGLKLEVCAISGDPVESLAAAAEKYGITAPLLSDPGLSVAQQYACAKPGDTLALRTLVLVGQDGRIAWFARGFHLQPLEKALGEEAEAAAKADPPATGSEEPAAAGE